MLGCNLWWIIDSSEARLVSQRKESQLQPMIQQFAQALIVNILWRIQCKICSEVILKKNRCGRNMALLKVTFEVL